MISYSKAPLAIVTLILCLLSFSSCETAVEDLELADLREGARQGDDSAQFNLAVKYEIGEGVPEDDEEAARWYRLAAEQGHAPAQYSLGARRAARAGSDNGSPVNWGA